MSKNSAQFSGAAFFVLFVSAFVGGQLLWPTHDLAAQMLSAKKLKAPVSSKATVVQEVASQKTSAQSVALGAPNTQYDFRAGGGFATNYTDKKHADDIQFAGPIIATGVTVDVEAPVLHTTATLHLKVYAWDSEGQPDTPNHESELFTGEMQVSDSGAYTFNVDNIVFPRRVFVIAHLTADDGDPGLFWSFKFNETGSPAVGHTEVGGWDDTDGWVRNTNARELSATVNGSLLAAQTSCAGDANEDRFVDSGDMAEVSRQFGSQVFPHAGGDFNGDGLVNGADLSVVLPNFGNSCAPSSVFVVASEAPALFNCRSSYEGGPVDLCGMRMAFTVANTAHEDVLVSKNPAIALSTTTMVNGSETMVASSSLRTVSLGGIPGDTSISYRVPAGSSRVFTYMGRIARPADLSATTFAVTGLKFGITDSNGATDASLNAQTVTPNTNAARITTFDVSSLQVTH